MALLKRPFFLAATCAVSAASAHAGLLIAPLGGVTLFNSGDDEVIHEDLGGTYNFYGTSHNGIDVSTNGNLNFTGNAGFANVGFPSSSAGAMIAPLWDDFTLLTGARVIENKGNGYFAVTWRNVATWWDPNVRHTFQAVLFNKDRSLGGFDFHAGDIAFAYGPMGDHLNFDDSATVGVNAGDGSHDTGLPSGATLIDSEHIADLHPDKRDFILYRYNGSDYDVSYEHSEFVVPEPETMAILGLATLALWKRGRRRGRR
ncbi:MAG: hypothetical protein QOJ65_1867 [Fimbriimonadaceae bacterium]|jgi:hypothetical protein|nr:hypothetical protein [Fimbriimonadaceae bacterium]